MNPPFHFVMTLLLSLVLYPVYGTYSFFTLIGGFLIDLDHYFWHVYLKKDINPINAYKFYLTLIKERSFRKQKRCLLIFHTAEFLILMIILSLYSQIAFIILLGLLFHYFIDYIYIYHHIKDTMAIHSVFLWLKKQNSK